MGDLNAPAMIVLIHGIASMRPVMWPLSWHLKRAGFDTRIFGYSSLTRDVKHHGNQFSTFLHKLAARYPNRKLHIVAHSLGGVITRQALTATEPPRQLHRVVTLATPHRGSRVAARWNSVCMGLIKNLRDVSDHPDSLVHRLGPLSSQIELGTIEASYDFVIPSKSSQAPESQSHIRIFSGHNGLLVRPKAARLVIQFMKTGAFD